MTFKPGDRVIAKEDGRRGTVKRSTEISNWVWVIFDDRPGHRVEYNICDLDPLPAKSEDVRLKLFGIVHEWLNGRCPGCTGFTATDLTDAILAKFPNCAWKFPMTNSDDTRARLKIYFMRTFGVNEWQAEAHVDALIAKFPNLKTPEGT